MANNSNSNIKPKFSAGMVTAIVTLAWLVIFGLVMLHGQEGINLHAPTTTQSQ